MMVGGACTCQSMHIDAWVSVRVVLCGAAQVLGPEIEDILADPHFFEEHV